jgi:hypothetical protein
MEAKDLRIGNIVTIDNNEYLAELKNIPLIVTGINETSNIGFPKSSHSISLKSHNSFHRYSQFNEFISPIPLTPEILEKCGFNKEEKKTNRNDIPSGTYQVYDKGHFAFNSIHGWWFNGKQLDFPPQYLHQLQNLYYFLCGEELNVSL